MERVASLEPSLVAVADLKSSMDQLASLREPMENVAALREPMNNLGSLTGLAAHPLRLVLIALAGLAVWAGVTFVAVRLAVLSAFRRGPTPG
jgi:hypothetical protein